VLDSRGEPGRAIQPGQDQPHAGGVVLGVLCAADFLVVLDGLIVAVALPTIQEALGIGPASLAWVVNAYVLCFGGFLLLGGRLADLYGRRRLLLVGLVLFAAGVLAAGLAPTAAVLVGGRAVQGVGAALMTPSALALLVATFRRPTQGPGAGHVVGRRLGRHSRRRAPWRRADRNPGMAVGVPGQRPRRGPRSPGHPMGASRKL
jgi:hypothetical protein